MSSEVDVVIIGAGAAGLSAAKEAERLSLTHTLVEASERIGGRAFSEEIAPGVFFDHGRIGIIRPEFPVPPVMDVMSNRE